jgi:hypothetical protein
LRLGFGWLCLAAACTGGQSGTETPSTPPPNAPDTGVPHDTRNEVPGKADVTQAVAACPCAASSEHAVLLRATLQAIDDCTARARIDEVLSPAQPALASGDVVGGSLPTFGHCGQGLDLSAGDDVLIVYVRGTQDAESCVEYGQCIETQCAKQPEPARDGGVDCFAACAKDTRAACAAHADEARLGGQLVVARYGRNLVFGYEATDAAITLPKSEMDRLLDAGACGEWFMQHATDAGGSSADEPPRCLP